MFVRMTLIEGVGDIAAATQQLEDGALPAVRELKGFRGMTASADREAGLLGILTLWDTEADMEASATTASQVREEAAKAMGGKVVDVQSYEQVLQEIAGAPPGPGCPLLITPIKMDPAKVDENIAFFKANVLPEMKATPGFVAVRNMINRKTGEGMVGIVLADQASVAGARSNAAARRERATQQGVELGDIAQREVVLMIMN